MVSEKRFQTERTNTWSFQTMMVMKKQKKKESERQLTMSVVVLTLPFAQRLDSYRVKKRTNPKDWKKKKCSKINPPTTTAVYLIIIYIYAVIAVTYTVGPEKLHGEYTTRRT